MKILLLLLLIFAIIAGLIMGQLHSRKTIQLQLDSAVVKSDYIESVESVKVPINQPVTPKVLVKKKIDSEQLYRHLEVVVGERYSEGDRSFIRNYLVEQLQKYGFYPSLNPFATGVNIWAKRTGNAADTGSILIAAHYDTVINSPGADDNGTGLAVVLEIARLLAKTETPLSLEIAFFDQEEAGLKGSFAFISETENLEHLKGVIILDMVGYACHQSGCQTYPSGLAIQPLLESAGVESPDKGEFLAVVGEAEHLELLKAFQNQNQPIFDQTEITSTDKIPAIITVPVPFKGLLSPDVLRSDHAPFWTQGIPAVLITDTAELRSPHYHQQSDTLDSLDQPFFVGSAQIILDVIQDLLSQKL